MRLLFPHSHGERPVAMSDLMTRRAPREATWRPAPMRGFGWVVVRNVIQLQKVFSLSGFQRLYGKSGNGEGLPAQGCSGQQAWPERCQLLLVPFEYFECRSGIGRPESAHLQAESRLFGAVFALNEHTIWPVMSCMSSHDAIWTDCRELSVY